MSKSYGRDRERTSVLRFLSEPGGLLAIDGPPCAGKTLLLHEAVEAARDLGYAVVLVPGERLATSADLCRALEQDAATRPLIAVDHAHRDPTALLALLPRLRGRPVTALLALTGAVAGPEVRCALAERGDVLTLGPVDDAVAERLVRALLGAAPDPALTALVATAGGNPRLIADLVLGLREEDLLEVRAGVARLRGDRPREDQPGEDQPREGWLREDRPREDRPREDRLREDRPREDRPREDRPREDRLPRRVLDLVGGRVEALPSDAARLVRAAAVVGRSFLLRDVAAVVGEDTAALLPAADRAVSSGLVVCADERWEFDSDLVRRAVLGSTPPPVLHALRHATPVPRADRADRNDRADRADRWTPVADEDRGADAVHGVRALAAGGRLGAAIALARDSLGRRPGPAAAAELHVVLAGILLADGRPSDAAAELEHVVVMPDAPEPLRRLASAGRLLALYFSTGSRAGAHALSVLTARDREASDADVVMAATVHSCLEWRAGNLAESLYWGRQSTRWELDRPTAWWQSQSAVSFALKLSALGEFADAERLVRGDGPDEDDAVTSGAPAARAIARARVLTQAGRLDQARAAARKGLLTARDRGLRLLVPLASTVLATVALHRGEVVAAAEHVRRYRADLVAGEAVLHSGQYDWVELLLTHAQGGPGPAVERARERVADPDATRRMLVEEPGAAAWLVRLALAADDVELARAAVAAARELAAANPGIATVSVAAAHARAVLDRDVEELLVVAGRHHHPWAKANANEDLAALLAEAGHEGRAAAHTALALRIFERMGAEGEAARLRRGAGPALGGGADWQRLSEPERDIARLVGAGLTNRQVAKQLYLSPHTVNYHLRGIFRKLGISSRVELARLAHEQETSKA
ncbi:LuxR C-terminal-related transcriptional regulator [Saccharothrix sp. BKS2]|uniref:helix-turn-helix transcriptional regulator n=1 Tax=Saccharothrix sp. BKS2 TaxID=3064400 RepID=UPI0039E910ED